MINTNFKFDEKLDTAFLKSIYEDDFDYAGEVFEQYLKLTPAQLSAIDDAFESERLEELRQQLHKIKPVFSYVGLTAITAHVEELERKCKQVSSVAELGELYTTFKNKVTDFNPVIENQLIQLKKQVQ